MLLIFVAVPIMNWTGGRLQRSMTNSNTLIKKQKEHFAKSRLRLQSRPSQSPYAFSIAHGRFDHEPDTEDDLLQEDLNEDHEEPEQDGGQRNGKRSHPLRTADEPQPKRRRSDGPPEDSYAGKAMAVSGSLPQPHPANSGITQRRTNLVEHNRKSAAAEGNTLENAKRNLLKKSDWMGLSAARPLRMSFTAVEEMENIGKRREITVEDRQRTKAAKADPSIQPGNHRHVHLRNDRRDSSILRTEDASIRFGSNVHQSQTTVMRSNRERQTSEIAASSSTGSMLLDKFERVGPSIDHQQEAEDVAAAAENSSTISPGAHSQIHSKPTLHFLDQVRDSESFDEVKARSNSRSSKALAFPPPPLSRPVARRAAKRCSYPQTSDSSSVVNGQPLLPCSVGQFQPSVADTQTLRVTPYREASDQEQTTKEAPTMLSSEFWPRDPQPAMPRPNIPIATRDLVRAKESPPSLRDVESAGLKPSKRMSETPETDFRETDGNERPLRRAFTLEHQILEEESALGSSSINRGSPVHTLSHQSLRTSPAATEQEGRVFGNVSRPNHESDVYRNLGTPLEPDKAGTRTSANAKALPTGRALDTATQRNENEAWMKYVFKDFDDIRNGFEFESRPKGHKPSHQASPQRRIYDDDETSMLEELPWRPYSTQDGRSSSPAKTIETSANTILFRPQRHGSSQPVSVLQPSETDFLTQLSPMEGKLDERLADISVYNNAARSVRSFVTAPSLNDQLSQSLRNGAEVDTGPMNRTSGFTFAPTQNGNRRSPSRMPNSQMTLPGSRSTHRHQPACCYSGGSLVGQHPIDR